MLQPRRTLLALAIVGVCVTACDEDLRPVRIDSVVYHDVGWLPDMMVRMDAPPLVQDSTPAPADASPPAPDQGLSCQSGEKADGGHCYRVIAQTDISYSTAKQLCSQKGAQVASLHSLAENNFVYGMLSSTTQGVWIGLRRSGGSFAWDDGTPLDYQRWAPGEPNDEGGNEDCVVLWGPGLDFATMKGKWNDAPCYASPRDHVLCKR